MSSSSSMSSPTQRYAAGVLFGLALHQSQILQTSQLGLNDDDDAGPIRDRISSGSGSSDSVSDDPLLWVHESSDLRRPIFQYLEIDSKAWSGLEETCACSPVKRHAGAFLRLLSEETGGTSCEVADKEHALSRGVDAMASSFESSPVDYESKKEKQHKYESELRERFSTAGNQQELGGKPSSIEEIRIESSGKSDERPWEELTMLGYPKKVAVLYELLSACLTDTPQDNKEVKR